VPNPEWEFELSLQIWKNNIELSAPGYEIQFMFSHFNVKPFILYGGNVLNALLTIYKQLEWSKCSVTVFFDQYDSPFPNLL